MAPPSRRELLRGAAAFATLAVLPGCGGSNSGSNGSLPGPNGSNDQNDGNGNQPPDGGAAPRQVFQHGVASGDPLPDRVILWTRISDAVTDVPVAWEIATDPQFTSIVRSSSDGLNINQPTTAGPASGYTFKIDADKLAPGTTYFYRFSALGQTSPAGRTKTATTGQLDNLRLAFVTCSDFSRGLWNAYARVAERDDIDAVVHLGDYIYETDRNAVRAHQPPVEIRSLDEYRARYASYRAEPELQALHAAHPMIWVWDDHETVDGTWIGGADPDNHDPEEDGPFEARKLAARTAAFEWLPIRLPEPETNPERIYRRFAFGDLVDLTMLDTRRIGRDQQVEGNLEAGFFTQTGEFTNPDRHILGAEQEQWFIDGLNNSSAQWRIIGNQVVFSQIKVVGAPNATNLSVFANNDQWDGYSPARDRIFDAIETGGINNLIFMTGDVHAALAFEVTRDPNNPLAYVPRTGIGTLAVEFVTPSISSAGDVSALPDPQDDPEDVLENLIAANGDLLRTVNPHGQYFDSRNGYMLLDINRQRVQAEYWLVPTVTAETDEQIRDAVFTVPNGEARIAGMNLSASTRATASTEQHTLVT